MDALNWERGSVEGYLAGPPRSSGEKYDWKKERAEANVKLKELELKRLRQ
jgi:hypothetical protein